MGEAVADAEVLQPAPPVELQVEVTGACNLRCHMCLVRYRPPKPRRTSSLHAADLARLLDELPTVRRLTLQGLGEPLLAPELREMVELAVGRGLEVGFNTNATLLDLEWSTWLVASGVAWVHVSIEGATAATHQAIRAGSRHDRVVANLRGLVAARRAAGGASPWIQVNTVAMASNVAELPELVRAAAAWGVDRLWVQNLSHDFADTDPAGDFVEIRRFAAREALWPAPSPVVEDHLRGAADEAERLGFDLRLPGRAEAAARARRKGEPGCDWPWRSAYVTHDLQVQPCCMVMGSDRATLGDLRTSTAAEVWHGPAYQHFRERLLGDDPPDVCRGCAAYRRAF